MKIDVMKKDKNYRDVFKKEIEALDRFKLLASEKDDPTYTEAIEFLEGMLLDYYLTTKITDKADRSLKKRYNENCMEVKNNRTLEEMISKVLKNELKISNRKRRAYKFYYIVFIIFLVILIGILIDFII